MRRWSSHGCRRRLFTSAIPTAICWSSSRCCRSNRGLTSACFPGGCGSSSVSRPQRTRLSERHDEQESEQQVRHGSQGIGGGDPGLPVQDDHPCDMTELLEHRRHHHWTETRRPRADDQLFFLSCRDHRDKPVKEMWIV